MTKRLFPALYNRANIGRIQPCLLYTSLPRGFHEQFTKIPWVIREDEISKIENLCICKLPSNLPSALIQATSQATSEESYSNSCRICPMSVNDRFLRIGLSALTNLPRLMSTCKLPVIL